MKSISFARNLAGTIECVLTKKFLAAPPKINVSLIDETYFDYNCCGF
jgi:hypothetical protein